MEVTDEILETEVPTGVEDEIITPPVKGPKPTESNETGFRRRVKAAVIASEARETPFLDNMFEMTDPNNTDQRSRTGSSLMNEQADILRKQRTEAALDLFINRANPDSQQVADVLAITQDEETAGQADPQKGNKEYVNAHANPNLEPATRQQIEFELDALDQLATIAEDIDGYEVAGDLALEVALAPKFLIDNFQLTGEFFGDQDTVQRTLGMFRGASLEEQKTLFPILRDMALESMPRQRALGFLAALFDPAAEQAVLDDFGLWSVVDTAAIAAGVLGAALKLRKALNPIKAAAKLGDYERAADMNMAVLSSKDEELGAVLDVPRLTAADNAQGFKADDYNDAADGTISPAVHERIFAFRDQVKKVFGDITEGRTFAREGFLEENDRLTAVARIDKEYETYIADRFQGKDKIANITSVESDTARGKTFEFEVTTSDGRIIKDKYTGNFQQDEVGMWQNLPGAAFFRSELAQTFKTDLANLTKAATRLDLTSANIGSQLRTLAKDASKPIRSSGKLFSRKQRVADVDSILISGDDMLKEFTPAELKAGVNGVKLDEDQMEYYYNMRGVMNGLGIVRNMDTRANMLTRNVMELNLGTSKSFGEVLDLAAAKRRAGGSRGPLKTIFRQDGDRTGPVELSDLDLDAEYANGYRLSRLEEDTMIGGKRFKHVLVKSDDVRPLPALVVDIKKGYIPRVNPDALYFVQAFTPSTLDGIADSTRKAVRSFDSKAAATRFAKNFESGKVAEGFTEATQIRVVTDGELEAFKAGDSGLGGAHGLFHSPRARNPIPHNDGDASSVPRTSALESIELYLENSKNFISRNEWRMGAQRKWENTARFMLPGNKDITFDNPGAAVSNAALKVAHDKISEASGFMNKSERAWESTVKNVHEFALGSKFIGRGKISDFILSKRQSDPLAVMRSLTFHSLLGVFNPVQLWVQAQGAAVAMSINVMNPVRFQKVFRGQNALALVQHAGARLNEGQLNKIAKLGGFKDAKDLQASKELWDKSGLYQSVLSSADVEAAARGFPTTGSAIKDFADSGLLFFRAGELFNRRTAFLTAIDELGGAAKVQKSDALLKEAMDRSNNLILNLGKANRAQWQKGLLSIPTQFLQIQAKTIESIFNLNGAWTKSERVAVLAGQVALYGTAGVFGGDWAMRNILSASGMTQLEIDELDPRVVQGIQGGFSDYFANVLGAEITVADRGALLNGMDQSVMSFFTDENTLFNWVGGPSSVMPTKMFEVMREFQPWFVTPQDINGETDLTAQDVSDSLRRVTTDVSKLIQSPVGLARQYQKFRLMTDLGVIRDKNGNFVSNPEGGFNWQTEWATLIGFKPTDLQLKFDISDINQEERDYVTLRTNMMLKQFDEFMSAHNRARESGRQMTEEEKRQHRTDYKVMVETLQPHVRRKVLQAFRQRLRQRKQGNSQLDRQKQRYWDNFVVRLTDTIGSTGSTVSDDSRVIQISPTDREE